MDPGNGDVVTRMSDDKAAEHRLPVIAIVIQNELGEDGLHFLGRYDMAAYTADVGLGRLHETLHEFRLGGKNIRFIGEDIRGVGQRDMLKCGWGKAIEVIAALMILVKSNQLGFFVCRTFRNGHAPISFPTMSRPPARRYRQHIAHGYRPALLPQLLYCHIIFDTIFGVKQIFP